MSKCKPEVGDKISFQRLSGKNNNISKHNGVVTWIASSGAFVTVRDHDVHITNALGEPLVCEISVEIKDIICIL